MMSAHATKLETKEQTRDQMSAAFGVAMLLEVKKALPAQKADTPDNVAALDHAVTMLQCAPAQRVRLRQIERQLRKPMSDVRQAEALRQVLREDVLRLLLGKGQ